MVPSGDYHAVGDAGGDLVVVVVLPAVYLVTEGLAAVETVVAALVKECDMAEQPRTNVNDNTMQR